MWKSLPSLLSQLSDEKQKSTTFSLQSFLTSTHLDPFSNQYSHFVNIIIQLLLICKSRLNSIWFVTPFPISYFSVFYTFGKKWKLKVSRSFTIFNERTICFIKNFNFLILKKKRKIKSTEFFKYIYVHTAARQNFSILYTNYVNVEYQTFRRNSNCFIHLIYSLLGNGK